MKTVSRYRSLFYLRRVDSLAVAPMFKHKDALGSLKKRLTCKAEVLWNLTFSQHSRGTNHSNSAYLPGLKWLRPTFRANCLRQNIFPRKTSLTQLPRGYYQLFPTSESSIWLRVIWLKVSTEMQKVSKTNSNSPLAYSPK